MHITEMLHNDLRQPLCIKVLQRRAEARKVSGRKYPQLDLCQYFQAFGLYDKISSYSEDVLEGMTCRHTLIMAPVQVLQHHAQAVADLQLASTLDPENDVVRGQLEQAKADIDEQRREVQLKTLASNPQPPNHQPGNADDEPIVKLIDRLMEQIQSSGLHRVFQGCCDH